MTDDAHWPDDSAGPTEQFGAGQTDPIPTPTDHLSSDEQDPWSGQETPMTTQPFATSASTADDAGSTSAAHATGTGPGVSQSPAAKGPRMSTVVWGLVLTLLGLVVIAVGLGVDLQLEFVFIGILGLAGLTLLIGAIAGAGKREK